MRLVSAVITLLVGCGGVAQAAVLERAAATGELRFAFRADAQPFSFLGADGKAAGFSVELCRAVAREAAAELGRSELKVVEIPVTGTDRLAAIEQGRADLLCEATTLTLGRREELDFSLLTFATGASLLYAVDGPTTFEELAGKKVGVLDGSTTESGLREALDAAGIDAEVIAVPTHTDGIEQLAAGRIAAYFGDGAILLYQLMQSPFRDRLRMSDKVLSFEPYALGLPKGDDGFRLVVDRTIAKLARSGEIARLFEAAFGEGTTPSDLVRALWMLNSIPD